LLHHQADEIIANIDNAGHVHANDDGQTEGTSSAKDAGPDLAAAASPSEGHDHRTTEREQRKLKKMGIKTAIAFGMHNFPEGLATFVAALNNPQVGAILAIAISIHNIPEGLCIALPIYYATGSRLKAFGWAVVSGAPQPLAALLGWAVLANVVSDAMYATMFGVVAGMLVTISIRELLPTAHRYDPEDSVASYSFIGGTIVMAVSLVLFEL